MTEKELQDLVVAEALQLGILVGVTPDSRRAFSGEPDLRLVGRSAVLWCELKSDDGELSPAQHRWKYALRATGAWWKLYRPADWHSGLIRADLERMAP